MRKIKLPYKAAIRVVCLVTIFCLSQILPFGNYSRVPVVNNITLKIVEDNVLQEQIQKVILSCVYIEAEGLYNGYYFEPVKWSGSGVIVSSNGIIITAGHVVKGATKIWVTLNDGRKFEAENFEYETITDAGVIKINAKDLPVISLGNSDDNVLGDQVFIVGCPLDKALFNTVTSGIISGLKRDIPFFGEKLMVQTDAQAWPGNSGGGLFNLKGELIGILVGGYRGYDGIGICVPSNILKYVIEKYCAGQNLEKAGESKKVTDELPECRKRKEAPDKPKGHIKSKRCDVCHKEAV